MTASGKRTLALSLLIGLATMPDAIVPIALKSAVVDRWHVSMSMATWFAAASLLGAVLVLPMLRVLDRRFSPGWTIAWASIFNAVVLAVMSASIDLGTAMVLRVIAGGMDMVTLAVLLGLLERGDPDRSGHRFGPASMAIMVGLAVGFGFGGMLAKELGGQIFLVGAAFSVLLAVAAGGTGGLLKGEAVQRQPRTRSVRYWPALAFGFADRGISAIVTVPVTLFLISDAGHWRADRWVCHGRSATYHRDGVMAGGHPHRPSWAAPYSYWGRLWVRPGLCCDCHSTLGTAVGCAGVSGCHGYVWRRAITFDVRAGGSSKWWLGRYGWSASRRRCGLSHWRCGGRTGFGLA